MAKPYVETSVREGIFATDLASMWKWFADREAQVAFDDRVVALTVISGEWNKPGCIYRSEAVLPGGVPLCAVHECIDVREYESFTSRMELPHLTSTTVHSTTSVPGGVLYRQETRRETKPVGWFVRRRLAKGSQARDSKADPIHAQDMAVIQAYLDSLGGAP